MNKNISPKNIKDLGNFRKEMEAEFLNLNTKTKYEIYSRKELSK